MQPFPNKTSAPERHNPGVMRNQDLDFTRPLVTRARISQPSTAPDTVDPAPSRHRRAT